MNPRDKERAASDAAKPTWENAPDWATVLRRDKRGAWSWMDGPEYPTRIELANRPLPFIGYGFRIIYNPQEVVDSTEIKPGGQND